MELISPAKFSRKLGVSRAAISSAIKRGALRTVPDGKRPKIDLHDKLTIDYMRDKNAQRTGTPTEATSSSSTSDTDKRGNGSKADSGDNDLINQGEIPGAGPSPVEAKTERILTQNAREKINLAKEMGLLIEKDMVDKLFDKLYAILLNHFHPAGDRLSPVLCDVAGVTDPAVRIKMKKIIDEEVTRGLREFKREAENADSKPTLY